MERFDIRCQRNTVLLERLFEMKPRQAIKTFDCDSVSFVSKGIVIFQMDGINKVFFAPDDLFEKILPEVSAVSFFALAEVISVDAVHKIGRDFRGKCESKSDVSSKCVFLFPAGLSQSLGKMGISRHAGAHSGSQRPPHCLPSKLGFCCRDKIMRHLFNISADMGNPVIVPFLLSVKMKVGVVIPDGAITCPAPGIGMPFGKVVDNDDELRINAGDFAKHLICLCQIGENNIRFLCGGLGGEEIDMLTFEETCALLDGILEAGQVGIFQRGIYYLFERFDICGVLFNQRKGLRGIFVRPSR